MERTDSLPRADEAERYLAGCLIKEPGCAANVIRKVRPLDIVDPMYRAIIEEALQQQAEFKIVDPIRVAKALKGRPEFNGEDPNLKLYELGSEIVSLAYLDTRIADLLDKSKRRRLDSIGEAIRDGARNGQPPDATLRAALADINDYRREATAERPSFSALTAAEFDSSIYEQHYLVQGMLVELQPAIVAAIRKGMKTSVLMDYAIAQAAGGYFLGKFPVSDERRTLFCSGESGLATLQETARRICKTAGYELSKLDNLLISTDLPKCGNADNLEDFRTFIGDEGAEVVIIDPAYLCFPSADAGNLFAQGEMLRGLNDIIAEREATLLLIHHMKKLIADPYGQPELENIAWSGFQEWARQWWLLGRREPYEPGTGVHRLWLSAGGSAGHSALWAVDIDEGAYADGVSRYWKVVVQRASEARTAEEERKAEGKAADTAKRLEIDRAAVCKALAKHPEGMTQTAIRNRANISGRRWPSVLADMLERQELVECEVVTGNQKKPKTGYRLNQSEGI